MKQERYERLLRAQKAHHRTTVWDGNCRGGLYVPHSYDDVSQTEASWWADVGFILNRRRVMVWWQHPRNVYLQEIDNESMKECGSCDLGFSSEGTAVYKKVGASRKKKAFSVSPIFGQDKHEWLRQQAEAHGKLCAQGIDFEVLPSSGREMLSWATGFSLVAPLEVRNLEDLSELAGLARELLRGQTTLLREFPGFKYTKVDWLADRAANNWSF